MKDPSSAAASSSIRPLSRLAMTAALLAGAAAALALLSSFGTRWDSWHFRTGFAMLRWAAFGAVAVAALSRVALYRTRPGAPRKGLALAAAREMGWRIVAADPSAGRIEAVDATFWFGFKDDVVVRLTPADGETILDVRSVSRVGRGDLGVNARRIRNFLEEVQERL